jgi:hypothetical protein
VFIVSKFIEGSTLAGRIKENRPSFGEAAELVATVAEALHYAHCKGLNSNRPYDNHPSAKAHKIYAQKLCAFLKQNVLRHFEISRNMQPYKEGGSISPQAEKPK